MGDLCIKYVNWGYQNNDESVSLIPKRDPMITNFSIPDPGIENPIPRLQSLRLKKGVHAECGLRYAEFRKGVFCGIKIAEKFSCYKLFCVLQEEIDDFKFFWQLS